jgi:Tfp pilus assembly protein PilW
MCTIKRSSAAGFTVIEFLIATTIGMVALGAAAALSVYTARSFAAMGNYMELDKNSRNALDKMTQIVREADGVLNYGPQAITLSYHGQTLSFNYSPTAKTLTLVNTNNVRDVLLTDCTFLNFQIYQRNAVAGTYNQYPVTADESAAKIVQVAWVCSRYLIGHIFNTESVQSAKIVIRKQ